MVEWRSFRSEILSEDPLHAYPETSALVGVIGWVAVVVSRFFGFHSLGNVAVFLSLAPLVIVPLCLRLVSTPRRDGKHSLWYRTAVYTQPGAGTLAVFSLFLPTSAATATLVALWFVVTVSVSLFGVTRLLQRGVRPVEELLVDSGLVYSVVGGFWFVTSRAGANPLGFDDVIVELTAVHFHYAGFALPILLGLTGRVLLSSDGSHLFSPAGYAVVAAPGLIALGITFSALLEAASVALLAVGVAVIAVLGVIRVVPRLGRPANLLVLLSYVSVLGVVALGFSYAVTSYGVTHVAETDRYLLDIPTMVVSHGVLASLGFALVGATGWWLVVREGGAESRVPAPGVPFSRLRARWKVGTDYFRRRGIEEGTEATGMMDDMSAYEDDRFDVSLVHDEVRRFYEETGDYEMVVVPEWERGFGAFGRVVGALASSVENVHPATTEHRIEGEVVGVNDEADGRDDVRAWTRWNAETGGGVLISTYSSHTHDGTRYMGFGAPLPGGNLSGILRLENIEDGGFLLTTRDGEGDGSAGDGGFYFVTPFLPVRIPLGEKLSVWASENAPDELEPAKYDADIVAHQEMFVLGKRFVTLVYYARQSA